VPKHALESANAANQTSLLLMSGLIGPPLGAIIFAVSSGAPLSLDAVSFLIAAALVARIARRGFTHPAPSGTPQRIWDSLREGVSFLYHHRTLRSLALVLAAVNAGTSGLAASLVLYVLHVLHLPGVAYGWIFASYAVGGAVGSMLGARLIRRWGQRACCMATLIGTAAAVLAVGLLPNLAILILALVLAGLSVGLRNVTLVSYRRRIVQREMLGRVNSAYRMIIFLAVPAATITVGALGSTFGLQVAYTIAGVALAATAFLAIPTVRQLPGPRRLDSDTRAGAG
jgi:MFS family permease